MFLLTELRHFYFARTGHYYFAVTQLFRIIYIMSNYVPELLRWISNVSFGQSKSIQPYVPAQWSALRIHTICPSDWLPSRSRCVTFFRHAPSPENGV
jgi:hypothetical protein